jgi:hypothetical protein
MPYIEPAGEVSDKTKAAMKKVAAYLDERIAKWRRNGTVEEDPDNIARWIVFILRYASEWYRIPPDERLVK